MVLRELTTSGIILRIFAALLLGGMIGLERELKNRPAGLRTYMLVCVGSCLIMMINQYIYQVYQTGDPVRMGAQVVSGIGFLGAGTIVVTRRNQIRGLTTAAGLWAAAAVGLALGIGFFEAALAGSFSIFAVMSLLQRLDSRMRRNSRFLEVYFELSAEASLGDFLKHVRETGLEVQDIQLDRDSRTDDGCRSYTATLKAQEKRKRAELIAQILHFSGIVYLEEL